MADVTFERHPSEYRHWQLDIDGQVATLTDAKGQWNHTGNHRGTSH